MLWLFKKSFFTTGFNEGVSIKNMCPGAHEHHRHAGHYPLLPVAPPGGARGLRDHRQGGQDRPSRQGNIEEREGEDSLLSSSFYEHNIITHE
jgi:hypothetical protein